MRRRRVLAASVILSCGLFCIGLLSAFAGPTGSGTGDSYGHSGNFAPGGPRWNVVYINESGYFDLEKRSGTAKYEWLDGVCYSDDLTFEGQLEITGSMGRDILVYVYRAEGGGNTWYLAFGVKPLPLSKDLYPIFYCLGKPQDGDDFHRWKTASGTHRLEMK